MKTLNLWFTIFALVLIIIGVELENRRTIVRLEYQHTRDSLEIDSLTEITNPPVAHHPVIDTEVAAYDMPDTLLNCLQFTRYSSWSQIDSCGREELLQVDEPFFPIYNHSEIPEKLVSGE